MTDILDSNFWKWHNLTFESDRLEAASHLIQRYVLVLSYVD